MFEQHRKGSSFMACLSIVLIMLLSTSIGTAQESKLERPPERILGGDSFLEDLPKLRVARWKNADPNPACPGGKCPGLGNAFYLPKTNAFDTFTGGSQFFIENRLNECVNFAKQQRGDKTFIYAKSTEDFLHKSGIETKLSGSYNSLDLTFNATASAVTGYSSESHAGIQSSTLDVTFISGVLDFKKTPECWTRDNVNPSILSAFEVLPLISDPTSPTDWEPYTAFLKNWGSHIMVQQALGSRFQQWESILDSSGLSQNTLQAKACAEVEGITDEGGWAANGCAGYNSEERKSALSHQTNDKRLILGGSDEARKGLLKGVTKASLDQFIDSAGSATQAARFGWEPIWQLLGSMYVEACDSGDKAACEAYQRSLNLEATFNGWIAVGCSHVRSAGYDIQKMRVGSKDPETGLQLYRCWAKESSCINNDGCGIAGAGSACWCSGDACVDWTKDNPVGDPKNPTGYRPSIRHQWTGAFNEGVNKSCYYQVGVWCKCVPGNYGYGDRNLWEQSAPSNIKRKWVQVKEASDQKKPLK